MGTMILLFSHSPSVIAFSSVKPSQAMRTADRDPAGGEISVELVCRQPFDDFPDSGLGCQGQIGSLSYKDQAAE